MDGEVSITQSECLPCPLSPCPLNFNFWPSMMTEGQLLDIMDEYGETLTPANDARWWEAAVSQLEGEDLGEDDDEDDEDGEKLDLMDLLWESDNNKKALFSSSSV